LSAIVGERDKALRATIPRNINPTLGKSLGLDVDPPAFHQNSAGIPTFPAATFTATPNGFAATVLWSITSGGKLTGTTPNQRTLLFSDMTADMVKVTATVVYNGQAYIAVRTIYKVIDGKPGKDADPDNLSPESLVAALEGRITESQLYADLRTRINLIDSPATVLGSVAAKVKAETDARAAAIDKEVQDRLTAAFGAKQDVDAFVRDYTYSKVQTDSALAIKADQIGTAYTNAVATAASDVRNYAYSKSAVDSAEAAQSAALTTSYTAYADAARTAAVSTASADVRSYSYAKSATDSAISSAIQQLRSEFVGSSGATEGYVTNYAYSKSQIDQSEAAQTTSITTNYKAYADAARDQAVSASSADVRNYAYSKSSSDSALAAQASTLRAEFTSNNGVTTAYLENYAYSKAQADSAISQSTQTLVSTVGQNTTAIQQQATSLNGLNAQLTWKIDNNGHVSGFGLASTPINGAPYSMMIFNVDVLAVALPGGTGRPIFTVGQVGGQPQAVFRSDLFVDGGLTARMIKVGTSDNIVPDPAFHDLVWWNQLGAQVADYSAVVSDWKAGAALTIDTSIGAYRDRLTTPFPMTPGATYLVEFQTFVDPSFSGVASAYWYIPGVAWHLMGAPDLGYTFSGNGQSGLPISFDGNSAKGMRNWRATVTVPNNGQTSQGFMRVTSQCSAGYMRFGSFSITRMSDSTLITDKGIKARHIEVDSISAVSGIIGVLESRPSGARVQIRDDVIKVFNDSNIAKVKIGNRDL
jgi:hypothetical protein